ncbi:MAG: hypothetical protein HOY79_20660 [Streptomyces sp.]|nr:hypothetical protein [Streptomyces sp.]
MTTTAPYVTAAEFQAYPTYLDLDDLRSGDVSPADQTAELNNLLLISSVWADSFCEQPLRAHLVTQNQRARPDRYGMLKLHADNSPIISVLSVSYGYTPTAMTTLSNLTGLWIEDGRQVVLPLSGNVGPWSGSLQFGIPMAGQDLFVSWQYLAGFASTTTSGTTAAGATSIGVADPIGIVAGRQYRIWEPGVEETVTVSPSYVPPVVTVPASATAVPLASPALFAHGADAGWSELPADAHVAIINYATALLMRPDNAHEDSFPDTRMASGTRQADSRQDGSGLIEEAERILDVYRRVR